MSNTVRGSPQAQSNIFRFNIYRFGKKRSLYRRGMLPYTFSKRQFHESIKQHQGQFTKALYYENWRQAGTNIRYWVDETEMEQERKKKYFVLSFEYEFSYEADQVYFAACPPYSYTYLAKELENIKMPDKYLLSSESLGRTVCGLGIPVVTFRGKEEDETEKSAIKTSKYLVILARTHPGETSGSWVADGLLEWLAADSAEVQSLLKLCTIKVVPMINPDGVFVGNYRTGMAGKDFNRCFNTGRPTLFPQIQAIRQLISQLNHSGEVISVIDLHGHSILRGSFIFGPSFSSFQNHPLRRLPQRLIQSDQIFRYGSCRFKNQKSKIQTARVYFQMKQKLLSFTIENSLGLCYKDGKVSEVKIHDWRKFGKQIGIAITDLLMNKPWQQEEYTSLYSTNVSKQEQSATKHKSPAENKLRKFSPIKNSNLNKPARQVIQRQTVQNLFSSSTQKQQTKTISLHQKTEKLLSTLQTQPPITTTNTTKTNLQPKSLMLQSKRSIIQTQILMQASQQDGNLSEKCQDDENDTDSEDEDLPDAVLEPVHAAIQAKEYPIETFRAASHHKTSEELEAVQVRDEEQSRKKMLLGRNTNGFKEVKFNIKRLSPENKNDVHYREYYKFAGNLDVYHKDHIQSYFDDQRKSKVRPRRQSTQTGQLPQVIAQKDLSVGRMDNPDRQPRAHRQRINSLTSKNIKQVLNLEQEVNEQVSHEISTRIKNLREKKNSIFSEKKLFEGDKGRTYGSPKSIVFRARRKL